MKNNRLRLNNFKILHTCNIEVPENLEIKQVKLYYKNIVNDQTDFHIFPIFENIDFKLAIVLAAT